MDNLVKKTADKHLGRLLFFAIFLMNTGFPEKHLQLVLVIARHCLIIGRM